MTIRNGLSLPYGNSVLPHTVRMLYDRCRPYIKHGFGHFFMYVFGRFSLVRACMVWIYGRKEFTPLDHSGTSLVEDVDVGSAVARIRRDGFFCGLTLRREVLEEFLRISSQATCFRDGDINFPFLHVAAGSSQRQTTQTFRLGTYTNALSTMPALRALASDPQLLSIARGYLGTEPALIGARMWWSFFGPADSTQQVKAGQGFHYDIDGYRGLTFFFYLTEVTPSSGPHIYVRGSHVRKRWRHLVSVSKTRTDSEIEETYGPEEQIIMCGPPGSGFAEDIFGFHKGLHPEEADRLILQIRYGLRSYTAPGD
jgi:hypothetical protein